MEAIIDFILANKFIVLVLGSVGINFILGVAKSAFVDFKWSLAFNGLVSVLKAWIGILVLLLAYFYIDGMEVLGIFYSAIAFFLVGLSTVYYINSSLINACELIGLHDVKILVDLDMKFKELLKKGLDEQIDLSAEQKHLAENE